jgi:vacuolar-type H+-ATPase subunit E/Vma4
MQRLDDFAARILAQAESERDQILAEIQEKRDAASAKAMREAAQKAELYVREHMGSISAESERRISARALENRRKLYTYREELSEELLLRVCARLDAYVKSPAYPARLALLLTEAIAELDGADDLVVCLRQADMTFASALRPHAAGKNLTFLSCSDLALGGLIVEAPALSVRIDRTFDTALEEVKSHLAETFDLNLAQ